MIDKKSFKQSVAEPLRQAGFKNKGQSWYLDGQDVIAVINLQKYDFGEMYFINVAFWLKSLAPMEFPAHYACHIDMRVESLFPQYREAIFSACTLNEADEDNLKWLRYFIRDELIPFYRECLREEQLKVFYKEGRFSKGMIRKEAKAYFAQ